MIIETIAATHGCCIADPALPAGWKIKTVEDGDCFTNPLQNLKLISQGLLHHKTSTAACIPGRGPVQAESILNIAGEFKYY